MHSQMTYSDPYRFTDGQRRKEIFMSLVTCLLFLMGIPKVIFIPSVLLFYGLYIYKSYRENPEFLTVWGLRMDNIRARAAVKPTAIFTAIAAVIIMLMVKHTPSWNMVYMLFLYPFYGIVQQFIVLSLVVNNLRHMYIPYVHENTLTLAISIIFGAIHLNSIVLAAATFLFAFGMMRIYLLFENIIVCGISHGVLATLLYYLVLGQDPLVELFSNA
jgi:uncharacterized protein